MQTMPHSRRHIVSLSIFPSIFIPAISVQWSHFIVWFYYAFDQSSLDFHTKFDSFSKSFDDFSGFNFTRAFNRFSRATILLIRVIRCDFYLILSFLRSMFLVLRYLHLFIRFCLHLICICSSRFDFRGSLLCLSVIITPSHFDTFIFANFARFCI